MARAARAYSARALAIALAAGVIAAAGCARSSRAGAAGRSSGPDDESRALIGAVNAFRATAPSCGRVRHPPGIPLTWDPSLASAGMRHASYLRDRVHLEHTGRDGTDPAARARTAGFVGELTGEVIARGASTATGAFDAWRRSVGHCTALALPRASLIGGYHIEGSASRGDVWVYLLGTNMCAAWGRLGSTAPGDARALLDRAAD